MYGSFTCLSIHFSMHKHNLQVLTRNNSEPTQYHRYHLAWHLRFIAECNISSLEDWSTSTAKINQNKKLCKLESTQAVLPVANIVLTDRQKQRIEVLVSLAAVASCRVTPSTGRGERLIGPAQAM
jgi:hypothetical protein